MIQQVAARLSHVDANAHTHTYMHAYGGQQALGAIDTEEENKWTLDELNIEFPHEWASSEFLEGRNW